nr:uncharacterized protein LOC124808312 [Hydra vulgaris]
MENIKIASVEHILVKKFNEGMNGCGKRCLSLITEVAGETHLSIKTVKSWIARHKAKSRKSDVDFSVKQKRKKVSINTQVLRGYDLWKQNQLLSLEGIFCSKFNLYYYYNNYLYILFVYSIWILHQLSLLFCQTYLFKPTFLFDIG